MIWRSLGRKKADGVKVVCKNGGLRCVAAIVEAVNNPYASVWREETLVPKFAREVRKTRLLPATAQLACSGPKTGFEKESSVAKNWEGIEQGRVEKGREKKANKDCLAGCWRMPRENE